ncbi:MAG: hypothetical protein KAY32_10585 [Candidatus Eisenbacteria sp.]|nr:hypothetical protein [Candidatus Eisenbacteria bacterium]
MTDPEALHYRRGRDSRLTLATGAQYHLILSDFIGVKTVLEVEDVLFHLNSAVMMPTKPLGPSAAQHAGEPPGGTGLALAKLQNTLSGLHVIRATYTFIAENPKKLLVIAGHTDTAGGPAHNFSLSEARANGVLHLLMGDRDAWASNCTQNHQVEDYQQILQHFAAMLLWPCDPGPVDNKIGPRTRGAVRRFQQAYNTNRSDLSIAGPDLSIKEPSGKEIDAETWRAFFDLYVWEIAIITLGSADATDLEDYRAKIAFVDDNQKVLPCGESFPIAAPDRKNYKSQRNRRVEILFFDHSEAPGTVEFPSPGDEPFQPQDVPIYDPSRVEHCHLKPVEPEFIVWLDIQTVNSLGHPVPDFELNFQSENEHLGKSDVRTAKTNADAHARLLGVPAGKIAFTDLDGKLLSIFQRGEVSDAVLHIHSSVPGIISIIVSEATEEQKREREEHRKIYLHLPLGEDEEFTRPAPREKVVQTFLSASERVLAADNLAMAAGMKDRQINRQRLVREVLSTYLQDYYPIAAKRGYYVQFLYNADGQPKLAVMDASGQELANFALIHQEQGMIGAYSLFESLDRPLFIDLAHRCFWIPIAGREKENTTILDLIADQDRDRYLDVISSRSTRVPIVFVGKTLAHYAYVALNGGTGALENYGENEQINDHIHDRNVAVVEAHATIYAGYIHDYVEEVEACKTEQALRKLGPPMHYFCYAVPPGATSERIVELAEANSGATGYFRAWVAIAAKVNEFIGRRSAGFFFVIKVTLEKKINSISKVEVEYNLNIDSDGKLLEKVNRKLIIGAEFKGPLDLNKVSRMSKRIKVGGGIEHEIDLETGEGKTKVSAKFGRYGAEMSNDGSAKFSVGPVSTEVNPQETTFGAGVTIEPPMGEGAKIYFGIHFQGLREDTVLAYVSNAPGFFERRPFSELLSSRTQWNDLTFQEQAKLQDLGFSAKSWNEKHTKTIDQFPKSARTKYHKLEAQQKIAAIHLGFNSTTWPSEMKRTANQ